MNWSRTTPSSATAYRPRPAHLEALRESLAEEHQDLPEEELESLAEQMVEGMSPEDAEGFWDTLGGVVKGAVGGAVPGAAAGPFGAIAGAVMGGAGALAGSLGKKKAPRRRPAPRPRVAQRPAQPSQPRPPPPRPASPVAQFVTLQSHPAVKKALVSAAAGPRGAPMVRASPYGPELPVAAILAALRELLSLMAAQANAADGGKVSDGYLRDGSGGYAVDPANPQERAERVLSYLNETRPSPDREPGDNGEPAETGESLPFGAPGAPLLLDAELVWEEG